MLYLYKNDLNQYQVIDDIDSKETLLIETNSIEEAEATFNAEISTRRKTTLMSFDGKEVKTYGVK